MAAAKPPLFVAETVTGSHVLEVKGYSVSKVQLGVGKSIDSGVFSVAGHRWILQYYPDGFNEESANHISIFVQIENPVAKAEVKARFCFSLLNHAGEPVSRYTLTSKTRIFSSTNVSWGYRTFIERKELESSYLRNDSFQIKCDLTVFKDVVRKETTLAAAPAAPPPDLQRHLGNLLASKVGGDMEFEVDGELFTAHRTEFQWNQRLRRITVTYDYASTTWRPGCSGACSTSSTPTPVMAQHLLVAADRYDLQRLKLICQDMLRSSMDVSIAATTLVLAEQHGCQGLKAACFQFLRAPGNLKAAMATDDGFQHLRSCSQ
ncbi:hypothetical protein BDA96_05G197900, partial [Sorghum bicolor]